MAYLINNRNKLQEDVRQLQQRLRYRDIDAVDCLELSLAIERLYAFEDFANSAMAILKLSFPEPMTYVSIDTNYAKRRVELERNKGK